MEGMALRECPAVALSRTSPRTTPPSTSATLPHAVVVSTARIRSCCASFAPQRSLYFRAVSVKKIGILTGGGDCPGLNAVIRAVVRRAQSFGIEVLGLRNGWLGLIDGDVEPLTSYSVIGILPKGGTILGTSRYNPLKTVESRQRLLHNVQRFGLDAIIAVGGDGTLSAAREVHALGVPLVGVPKTIDNDLRGTDYTFGFDTAVNVVRDAIDRLHTTAESHHRVMVVEVMGHRVG